MSVDKFQVLIIIYMNSLSLHKVLNGAMEINNSLDFDENILNFLWNNFIG